MIYLHKNEFIKIAITLICTLLGVFLPNSFLWVLAAINVLTIGIVHGANDLYILSKHVKTLKKWSFSYLFLSYVFFVFIMVLALYRVPQIALIIFVLMSAFHFGEQQWHSLNNINLIKLQLFYVAYGAFLFSLLFYTHQEQTVFIVREISGFMLTSTVFIYLLITSSLGAVILLFLNFKQLKNQLFFQLLAMVSLFFLFTKTSLMWSFSVYFVLWHSIPSLKEQATKLYPSQDNPIRKFVLLALPYWFLSMLGFVAILFFFKGQTSSLLALFFGFLAAITIPHVVVIFWMHQKK